jgi:xylulokinase
MKKNYAIVMDTETCNIIKTDKVQAPKAENVPEYEKYYQLYREIYPALKAQYAKLATL